MYIYIQSKRRNYVHAYRPPPPHQPNTSLFKSLFSCGGYAHRILSV